MGEIFEYSRLRHENEKLREMIDAMAKALAKRETLNTHPTWEVSADPILIAENTSLKEVLQELEQNSVKLAQWAFDQKNGVPILIANTFLQSVAKAREILSKNYGGLPER